MQEERLADKVAWVTGGGTGLGKVMARRFAELGAALALCGRRREPLEETAEEIRRLARIAASDLYLYYPSEVITAIKTDHLEDTFRDDLERGRRMVEDRFPGVPTAAEIFFLALKESLAKTAEQTVS